jgi:biopolymer transport protein ExbD
MAKVSKPKSAPGIDMTPMVDLAFLLVTFFMLSANFRTDEVVPVDVPTSIAETIIPNDLLVRVTIDKAGRVFFGITSKGDVKKNIISSISNKYKIQFNEKQIAEFEKLSDVSCNVNQLPQFLDMSGPSRDEFVKKTIGVPTDSTNNQLKEWIVAARAEMLAYGEQAYKDAKAKGFEAKVSDFKPKFILKVDGNADYIYARNVIETFRDIKENNLSFITSLKADPRKK